MAGAPDRRAGGDGGNWLAAPQAAAVTSVTVPVESFPPLRRLGPGDLKRCAALSVDRGWSPERAKWSLLLAACEVFGANAPDGRGLAGAVVLTRWAADYAAVGMMLVAARYERRGLGRALMEHLLRTAGDDATVTLFATDMGRPLYEKLGFAPVRRSVSFTGRFRPSSAPGNSGKPRARIRPATEADLPAILALDRAAFGADRGPVLTRLPAFADQVAVLEAGPDAVGPDTGDPDAVGPDAGGPDTGGPDTGGPGTSGAGGPGIAGYGAAWRNDPASTVIGPLVAPDGESARRLVAALAAGASTPVRLDLDPDRPELPGWAHARGLEPTGRTVVMARGKLTPRGLPGHLYTPISVALA
jgi:GNAT superfamily N-acetyltransferase